MIEKNQMVRNYLQTQMDTRLVDSIIDRSSEIGYNHTAGEDTDSLDTALLEEFKNQVKAWWEIDTSIKRLQIAVRERKKAQTVLSEAILRFMQENNIEDLNTRDGMLRYKSSYVKAPLSQKAIKQKLIEQFNHDERAKEAITRVFEDRNKIEKVSLRRMHL